MLDAYVESVKYRGIEYRMLTLHMATREGEGTYQWWANQQGEKEENQELMSF